MQSTDFAGCVAGNLRAAARAVTRLYDAALRDTGLRITQVAILATLRTRQPITLSALAAELASERSALARDVAVLERHGLVTSASKPGDRRARELRLTPLGARRLRTCAPAWRLAQQAVIDACGATAIGQLVSRSAQLVDALGSR